MLTTKLEADGHAVLNTGLRRSELMGEGIMEAKEEHMLGRKTMSLFYAADFADRLENKILPALRSGYIVLADRYIYTLMARATVRGLNKRWSHQLFGFAIVPDLIFYLDVKAEEPCIEFFKRIHSLTTMSLGPTLDCQMICMNHSLYTNEGWQKSFAPCKSATILH